MFSYAEQNYDTYDQELLFWVETMKQWSHYVKGANLEVLISCDHKHIQCFHKSIGLSQQLARWVEILSSYDLIIKHREGKQNSADRLSRWPNYAISYENMMTPLLAALAMNTITESYGDLQTHIKVALEIIFSVTTIRPTFADDSIADQSKWTSIRGALTYEQKI